MRVAPARPQLLRGETEDLLHDAVHVAGRLEPRGRCDARHRQIGVVEQSTGEVGSTRPRDLARCRADVLREQTSQVARAHTEPQGERVLDLGVEGAVGDETQRAAHELGRVDPTGLGLAIGPALQARPEPVGLGRRRVGVRARVAAQRPATAPEPAVDARGDDRSEVRVHDPTH